MGRPKAFLTTEQYQALAEADRSAYDAVPKGDGYIFGLEGVNGWRLEDVDGLSQTKGKLQRERDELKAALRDYDGLDAAAAREALEKVKRIGEGDPKASEKIEAIKKQLLEDFAKEKQTLTAQNQSMEQQLQRHLIEAAASQALAKHKGDAALLMPHIAAAVKAARGEDGKYSIKVVGPDGAELWSKATGAAGESMPVDEYVSTVLKQRFPAAFEGTGSSGSGASGSVRSGGGHGRFTLTNDQARDVLTYQAARAEAEKAGQTVSIVE